MHVTCQSQSSSADEAKGKGKCVTDEFKAVRVSTPADEPCWKSMVNRPLIRGRNDRERGRWGTASSKRQEDLG